ncbi:MAG: NTP transferase domain-containing protein [Flavobacteriales bacterium]|nr:NTP transferase domain-containing protein [Flavobacteriales bacterium]
MQPESYFIIHENDVLTIALSMLSNISEPQTLLVKNDIGKIIGTVTDGDIRRALLRGCSMESKVKDFYFKDFTYIESGVFDRKKIEFIKHNKLELVPVLNKDGSLKTLVNFKEIKTILPVEAIIMAGGVGKRLLPLTKDTPKPMLEIGGKPIIEYNIELLRSYGIKDISLSVKYKSEVIEEYFTDGKRFGVDITYLKEDEPYGTIGAVRQKENFKESYVLVMNSDLLTNINLEEMFVSLLETEADLIIATIDYNVEIPYGVVETDSRLVTALREKPTYTYYSNAGIYIFKKEIVDLIPKNMFFNATDLLSKLIDTNHKIVHYPINKYWLDIGKPKDFEKAQKDVLNIKF